MKRRSGWAEVQLDGALAYRLPYGDVGALGLAVGDRLSEADLDALNRVAGTAEAIRIALRYLSVRPRSRRELELQLLGKGIDDNRVGAVLERCDELGYLDDRAFAAALARDRIRLRPCGVRSLEADLRSRGVSPDDASAGIRAAMEEEGVSEAELLERAAARRAASLAGLAPDIAARRLFAFLRRRGFAAADAREWIERIGGDLGRRQQSTTDH
jgi:regulatory protein